MVLQKSADNININEQLGKAYVIKICSPLISYSVCMCVVIPSDCAVIFVQHLDKLILDMITPALY